ncbi:hypothetical protein NE237_003297 [Protea cynaroides]|uniref:Uncharacterized protein n=1 Tax=Protea cynaroides TaxID=273540 RepID=A0A9Q0QSF9_9MAGN|nr:hypothetical protein NE237_003297 [Protea cynaroides]
MRKEARGNSLDYFCPTILDSAGVRSGEPKPEEKEVETEKGGGRNEVLGKPTTEPELVSSAADEPQTVPATEEIRDVAMVFSELGKTRLHSNIVGHSHTQTNTPEPLKFYFRHGLSILIKPYDRNLSFRGLQPNRQIIELVHSYSFRDLGIESNQP